MARRRSHYRESGFERGMSSLGTTETLRQLREMGEHVIEAAKAELARGAAEVVADAKSRCPVRTGKLRDSIKAEPNSDVTAYKITANAQNNGFYYGQIVEFSPREEFHPFLYPALDANIGRIYGNIRAAINRAAQAGYA